MTDDVRISHTEMVQVKSEPFVFTLILYNLFKKHEKVHQRYQL